MGIFSIISTRGENSILKAVGRSKIGGGNIDSGGVGTSGNRRVDCGWGWRHGSVERPAHSLADSQRTGTVIGVDSLAQWEHAGLGALRLKQQHRVLHCSAVLHPQL